MPTQDVLQYLRERDPRFKEVPDQDLIAYVKDRLPDLAKEFDEDSTFAKMSTSERAKKNLASMQSGPARQQYEQAQASAQSDIDERMHKVGEAAKMAAMVAAAPLTGGTSLLAASGIMGTANLVGGGIDQLAKHLTGSTEAETGKNLALTLGFDFGAGALTELGLRGVLLPVGKKVLTSMAIKAAATIERGRNVLNEMWFDGITKLWSQAKPVATDITKPLQELADNFKKLPSRGLGEMGQAVATRSARAGELFDAAIADIGKPGTPYANVSPMVTSGGGVATKQPLDWVIAVKQSLSQMAYKSSDLTRAEKVIFARLTKSLDNTIYSALKNVGDDAVDLYRYTNNIVKAQYQNEAAYGLVEKGVRRLGNRLAIAALGGGAGSAYGLVSGEGPTKGGIAGAAAGFALPGISALALEQIARHPEAARELGRAINILMSGGREEAATALTNKAMKLAGVDQTVKQSALVGQ